MEISPPPLSRFRSDVDFSVVDDHRRHQLTIVMCASVGQAQTVRSYESLDRSAGEADYATAVVLFDGAVGNADYLDAELSGALGYRGERPTGSVSIPRTASSGPIGTESSTRGPCTSGTHCSSQPGRGHSRLCNCSRSRRSNSRSASSSEGEYATSSSRSGLAASMWVWVSCSRKNNEQAQPCGQSYGVRISCRRRHALLYHVCSTGHVPTGAHIGCSPRCRPSSRS